MFDRPFDHLIFNSETWNDVRNDGEEEDFRLVLEIKYSGAA